MSDIFDATLSVLRKEIVDRVVEAYDEATAEGPVPAGYQLVETQSVAGKAVNFYLMGDPGVTIDPTQQTYVVTHGWNSSNIRDDDWIASLESIRGYDANANILFVEWTDASNKLYDYRSSANDTAPVGETIGQYLSTLGLNPQEITLIGHSLGGHVMGNAGAAYQTATGNSIATIIALDPAGPLFEGGTGKPETERLSVGDADRVVVLHSTETLGYNGSLGHADLYLNNWRRDMQPGTECMVGLTQSHTYPLLLLTELFNGQTFTQNAGTPAEIEIGLNDVLVTLLGDHQNIVTQEFSLASSEVPPRAVIEPTGIDAATGVEYWTITDFNQDGIIDYEDLEAVIRDGLNGGNGFDPDQFGLTRLQQFINDNIASIKVTEQGFNLDGDFIFFIDFEKEFTATEFAASFGSTLGNTFDQSLFFDNPQLKITILDDTSYRAANIDIVASNVQVTDIANAIDEISELAGLGTPGLTNALNNLDTEDFLTLSLDIEGDQYALEFGQTLDYDIDLSPGAVFGSGSNNIVDDLFGGSTISGSLRNPKISYSSKENSDQSKSETTFSVQALVDDGDGNPDNDDLAILSIGKKTENGTSSAAPKLVEYRLNGQTSFAIGDYLPDFMQGLFPNLIINNPKFVLKGSDSVDSFEVQGTTTLNNWELGEDIEDFACQFLGINLLGLLSSELLVGVEFEFDNGIPKAIGLNTYLNVGLEDPILSFPFQVPNFDESFALSFNGIGYEYKIGITDYNGLETTTGLVGDLTLEGYDPVRTNEPPLSLIGGVKNSVTVGEVGNPANPSGVSTTFGGFFNLDALGDPWKNPFGIPDSAFRQVGIQLDFGSTGNAVGVIGDLAFGNYDFNSVIYYNSANPAQNGFGLTLNQLISLMDLFLGPVGSYTASQLSDSFEEVEAVFDLLNTIFDLTIQSFDSDGDGDLNPLFYYMPEDVNIAGEPYGAGLYINGEVNAWGATGRFAFNRAGGLFGSTETSAFLTLERLDLGGLGWFVLEGVDDPNTADVDESDELNFAFNTSDSLLGVVNSSFTADASVKLFGQTVGSGTAKIGTGGIDIDIDIDLFDILTVDASLFVGNPQNDDTIEAVQNADGTTELIQTFTNFGSQGNLILEGESVSTSLSFDGVDDYVELDSDRSAELAADLGSAMTVETWIKVDSFTKTWQAIVVKGDDSWRLQRRRDTDQLIFTIQGVGSTSSSVGVNDGGWHHVAAVYDGSTLKLYIDGELSGQNNASGSIPAGNYNMRIGGNAQFANREFDGQMDEIRIWNIARTQEEIQANLDHRLDPNTSGLIYYLPVDQRDRTQGEGFYETFDNGIPKTIISLPITDNNIGTTPDRYHQVPAETLDFHRIGNWALDTVVTGTNGNSVTNAGTLGAAVDGTVVGTPGTVAGLPENSDGALDFNGSSDGIVIPNNLAINTDSRYAQRSIELWFKADTLEGQQVIYEQGGAFNGFNLFLDGNQLKLGAWRDSVGKWLTTEISAGETYHVVLSFDQGTLSGYVNGTEIGSVATGFEAMGPHAEDIGVAHMKGDTRFFSAIDTTPPIAEWTLDGLSSINSATASVIGSPTAVGSLLQNDAGSALSFNGSTDGVHIFDNAAINTSSAGYGQKTIELWFSPDRLTGRQVIYEQGDTAHGLNLYLDENVLKLGAWVNNIGEWLSATVALGQTYHAVLQFDQGILKGYVNGVYLGELSTDFNTIAAHNGDVAIGYSKNDARFSNDNDDVLSGDGHYFEGTIEGLKLYNKITSPEEIVYNYRNGTEQFIGEGNYFDGVVDDLKLYRTALSAAQVQDIYAAGTSAPDNSTTTVEPIARWNLDGNRQNSGTLGSAVALSTVTTTASPGYTQGLTPSSTQAIKLLERFNQGIKVTDHPALNTGGPYAQRTVELWFEANNLSGINMLYEEGGTGNGLNIFLNGNTLSLGVWQNNVGKWLSTTVNVNETYQVVFSFDQGQLHGYLNGKLFGTTTTAFNAIPTHTGDIGIGYNNGGTRLSNTSTRDTGNYFDGILDDIRIYDVALTDAEILDSYQSAQEYPGGKFAHWRLNGNLNNSVNVGSAINGSAVGSPQLGVPGLVPGSTATHFNGFSDGIAIPNNDAINTQAKSVYTIELWFSADNLEGQQVIYEQGGGVNGFNIYLDNAQLNLGAWANSTGEWLSTTVQANQRYYLVLSFDSGTLTGYLNGESIGSVETGFTEMPAHTGRVGIAMMQGDTRLSDTEALSGDGKYFQGTIDEVALYSKILSPEQVRANYISGFAQGLTVEIFNNPNLENDPIAVDRVSGLDNLSLDANTSKKITGYIKAPVTGTYTFTTTSTGGTRLSVDGNQLIDNWQNPEQVLDLDGANDYVEITNYGAMYNLAQAFTVEAWINIDEFDSVWQTIVATGNQSWRLHRNNNTNKIAFTVGNQENEVIRTVNSQTSFPDGQWHHLAGVYDGTNVHLYVDGVLEGSSNATIAFDVPDSNFNITIGYNPESVGINGETGRHFDGKIDEVKLWDRALTAAEIVNNLTTDLTGSEPDLVGYWDFDDSEGLARVIDRSANANHGRFRGVFDPTQTQLNNWSNKILTFEEDYSSHFQPSTQTASKTIDLVAGQLYEIEFQTQGFGNATSPQLQWSYPGINDQVISNSVLFTPPYTKVSWQVSGGQNGSTFYGTDQDGAWEFFNGDSDRYAISPTFDVSTGGRLTFDLVLGGNTTISTASADQTINNGGSPVSPNYPVRLEYSVNGGATWTEIERYNSESILSDGNWRSIIVDLPAEAESPQTQFRWFQADDSSTSYSVNNWALDNVTVIQEATDLWLDIEGGKVFTAQQETNTASTAISDGDALYFTADAFDIVNPLGEEFQYLLRENEANLIPGDFNGDGKTDFIRQQK